MVFSASTITALLLFVPFSAQQGSPPSPADGSHGVIGITCFDFGGTQFTNSTKCPGSNNCCPTIDLCQADGFCKGNNGTNIRPPCTKFPWDNTCSPLCRFEEGTGFLPRMNTCLDGSWCCDADPQCCSQFRGFFIDSGGQIMGTAHPPAPISTPGSPLSTQPSTATTPAAMTSSSIGISSSTSVPAATSSTTSLTVGAAAGIGIGIAIAILILAALVLIFCVHRRKIRRLEAALATTMEKGLPQHNGGMWQELPDSSHAVELQGTARKPSELAGSWLMLGPMMKKSVSHDSSSTERSGSGSDSGISHRIRGSQQSWRVVSPIEESREQGQGAGWMPSRSNTVPMSPELETTPEAPVQPPAAVLRQNSLGQHPVTPLTVRSGWRPAINMPLLPDRGPLPGRLI